MKVDYVTRDAIRAIKPMNMVEFQLPTAKACNSARSQVTHVKNLEGGKFKVHVEYKDKIVRILRIA